MKLQPTLLQTRGYGCPNLLGFRLGPAMHDGIISVPLERHLRILLRPSRRCLIGVSPLGRVNGNDVLAFFISTDLMATP
jgi:hypothetical protein